MLCCVVLCCVVLCCVVLCCGVLWCVVVCCVVVTKLRRSVVRRGGHGVVLILLLMLIIWTNETSKTEISGRDMNGSNHTQPVRRIQTLHRQQRQTPPITYIEIIRRSLRHRIPERTWRCNR